LGGDEFIIMLEGLSTDNQLAATQAESVAQKILESIRKPILLQGFEHHGSISIGIILFRGEELTNEELLKYADTAMYEAKSAGRNTLRFFDPLMQSKLESRMALDADLRQALQEHQFKLNYQIQVNHDLKAIGAEVLLRWQHPERGQIPPLDFIRLAEETGLILPIGQWVLETACECLEAWEGDPLTRDLDLSVNVSARQFRQPDFVEQVRGTLARIGNDPKMLKLELTESMVLENIQDTSRKMRSLKEIGVRFSMDDFGTGYSSLSYLTQLPFDQLKIDQSFVRNIGVKSTDEIIIQTIIGMGSNLGMQVIAEGVETEDQRAFLERHNCHAYQGYLFGKPVHLAEFEKKLGQSAGK
jgi:EAL domain-containing protein (putative c-di-GMP-specific phosphodiesterase class I)